MNRKMIAALAIAVAGVASLETQAGTLVPGIGGKVYFDQDLNGTSSPDEALSGVSLNLYTDSNGNGVFEPGVDTMSGSTVSDGYGFYSFNGLNFADRYFVERPSQTSGSLSIPEAISGQLVPYATAVLVDDFQSNQVTKANPTTKKVTSTLFDPTTNVLGKERDLYLELLSGIGDVELRSKAFNESDCVLQYDNTSGVVGRAVVTWDGKDMSANPIPSLGLGNIDLTLGGQATGFLMKLGIDAAGAGDQLRIRLFKDSKTEFSELSVAFPVTGGAANEWAYIPFTDMVGGVSPGAVNAIQMLLGEKAKSVDAQVGRLETVGPTTQDFAVVPEPSSLVLALAGWLGLLGWRRR